MNDTAATSQSGASLLPQGTETLTAVHFGLIALVALFAILVIVRGIRKTRQRHEAGRQVEAHAEEAGVPPVADRRTPAPEPAAPVSADPAADEPAPPPPVADEPIAAAAPLDASPAALAADEPAAPVVPVADASDGPVTQLKGLGPKVAARLAELGVTTVGQLAALDDDGAARLDAELGTFRGRMARDRWVEQARFLAAGDRKGFEATFGRL